MKILDKLPLPLNGKGYPWDEWTDGQVRLATPGEDFKSTPKSFIIGLYTHARRCNLKVSVRQTPEGVAFQFQDPRPGWIGPARG